MESWAEATQRFWPLAVSLWTYGLGHIPVTQVYVFTGYGNVASRNINPAVMDALYAQARTFISR